MSDGNFVNPAPVEATERVEALDTVRGFALLGILLMNICSFGMPAAAESNPTVWGGATGVDFWFWWVPRAAARAPCCACSPAWKAPAPASCS